MAKCIISFQLPSLPCCQQVTRRCGNEGCGVMQQGNCGLGCHLENLYPQGTYFCISWHQLKLSFCGGNNGPGQDETNKQHYLKKSGAVDIITIIVITVFCLCHIFYNILFCHKTSLWWGQTLHLTICATLALYFFFLFQLSKIRAAALGLQLLLL